MSILQWYFGTKANYEALPAAKKSTEDNIFFLLDSSELYYLGQQYTRAVKFYEGALPQTPGTTDKIFVNANTLTGSVYRGSQWVTIFEQPQVNALDANDNGVVNAVTGAAAATLIESLLTSGTNNAVVSISWDDTTHKLSYTNSAGNTDDSTVIKSFADHISRDSQTGDIVLYDANNVALATINIPLDARVSGGQYDETTNALVLTMQNGTDVSIPASSLVGLYNEKDTATIDCSTVLQNGVLFLKFDVNLSATQGNALEIKSNQATAADNGLYLSLEHLISFVAANAVGQILVSDANGNAVASGKTIGAAALSVQHPSTVVATESAVASEMADAKDTMDETYLPLSSIRGSYAEFARAYGFETVS